MGAAMWDLLYLHSDYCLRCSYNNFSIVMSFNNFSIVMSYNLHDVLVRQFNLKEIFELNTLFNQRALYVLIALSMYWDIASW